MQIEGTGEHANDVGMVLQDRPIPATHIVGSGGNTKIRYASSLINARCPSRVIARTPLRIPDTMCLKNASLVPCA